MAHASTMENLMFCSKHYNGSEVRAYSKFGQIVALSHSKLCLASFFQLEALNLLCNSACFINKITVCAGKEKIWFKERGSPKAPTGR